MKKFIRFICFLLIVSTVMYGLNFFFSTNSDKDGIHIQGYFKEPENTLDVLLIGASELYTGFNSPIAWEKYGFTSYAVTYAGMQGSMYKTILKKALETQSPKLVVFEINGFLHGDKYYNYRRPIHAWFDSVGVDGEGKEFLKEHIPKENLPEFYLPFYKYHENWRRPVICARNAATRLYLETEGISYSKSFANTNLTRKNGEIKERKITFTQKSAEYMTELLKFCREEGLENVLFFRAPHCMKNTNLTAAQEIEKLIGSYGYRFVDFENAYGQISLDTKNDFYNLEHLNIRGMEKFTDFFGKYICDNYSVKTEHTEKTVERWNRCAEVMRKTAEECKNDKDHSTYYELAALENAKGRKHSPLARIKAK